MARVLKSDFKIIRPILDKQKNGREMADSDAFKELYIDNLKNSGFDTSKIPKSILKGSAARIDSHINGFKAAL